jgi:hypothetical protein
VTSLWEQRLPSARGRAIGGGAVAGPGGGTAGAGASAWEKVVVVLSPLRVAATTPATAAPAPTTPRVIMVAETPP